MKGKANNSLNVFDKKDGLIPSKNYFDQEWGR